MKPRYRPGKPATNGRRGRDAITHAKPLSENEMEHLREEIPSESLSPKKASKGKRANWNTDYEEGVQYDSKPMPHREPENLSIDGVRRTAKRRGH